MESEQSKLKKAVKDGEVKDIKKSLGEGEKKINLEQMTKKAMENIYLPGETQDWVKALKDENVFKLRRLLKKYRRNFKSPKFKRLYLASDPKLMLLVHYLRTELPETFFTEEELKRSAAFLDNEEARLDGHNPANKKIH